MRGSLRIAIGCRKEIDEAIQRNDIREKVRFGLKNYKKKQGK